MRNISWRPDVRSGHAARDSMSAAAVTSESPSAPAGGLPRSRQQDRRASDGRAVRARGRSRSVAQAVTGNVEERRVRYPVSPDGRSDGQVDLAPPPSVEFFVFGAGGQSVDSARLTRNEPTGRQSLVGAYPLALPEEERDLIG